MNFFANRQDARVQPRALGGPAVLLAIAGLVFSASTAAATLTVTNTADSGAGSLRAALAAAAAGDTIVFAPGVTGTISLATPLVASRALNIIGPGSSLLTISGNDKVQVLIGSNTSGTLLLEGLTITRGLGVSTGFEQAVTGGIAFVGAGGNPTLALKNVVVTGNVTRCASSLAVAVGAGIGSVLTPAGGSATTRSATVQLINSSVTNNRIVNCGRDAYGAGLGSGSVGSSSFVVTNSTISGNSIESIGTSSRGYGGGVSCFGALMLVNSTISGNSIQAGSLARGGGVEANICTTTASNSTLSGNSVSATSTAEGGGLQVAGSGTFRNVTIVNNSAVGATVRGGGVSGSDSAFTNALIAFNVGGDLFRSPALINSSANGNLIGSAAAGVILGPLADNGGVTKTHALLPGSAGIGTGVSTTCSAAPVAAKDQRGRVRPTACSVGAYEPQRPWRLVASGGNNQSATVGTPFGAPLAVTLFDASNSPVGHSLPTTFTPPASGASAAVAGNPATGNASGVSTSGTVTANTIDGSYAVSAAIAGVGPASFALTNLPLNGSPGCGVIGLAPDTVPNGVVGLPYAATFSSTGGVTPTLYSVTAGTLPPGLLLVGGTLDGTPLAAGDFSFSVLALGQGWDPGCGATISYQMSVGKGTQVLSFVGAPGALNPGGRYQPTVLTTGGPAPIVITVDPASQGICSVDVAGVVTAIAPGTCTILADQEGDANYLPAAQVVQAFAVQEVPGIPTMGRNGLLLLALGLLALGWRRVRR